MKTLFVSMDTVGSTRLSCLGATRVHTPNLDRIASEGALFSQAFATDIPTQPSHTAVFTARFGATTGIVAHYHPPAMLDETVPWLPSLMQELGCHTGAVDHLFAMKEWFIRGYEDYMVPPGRSRSPASVVNELAIPWIDAHAQEDFFLFLHFWDAHIPYVPPEPFKGDFTQESSAWTDPELLERIESRPTYALFKRNLYDFLGPVPNLEYIADLHYAEVAYLDHQLGLLFDHMERLGILDDTLVVLFGDHGEIMTEHDAWFDHAGLYDSIVHVPLIMRWPGHIEPAQIDAMVGLIDVAPTVLALQGVDSAKLGKTDGRSLLPVMRGETTTHRDFIPLSECTWEAKRGIRTPDWKLIRCQDPGIFPDRNGTELYDLRADPTEQVDVSEERADIVAELNATLDGWLAGCLGDRADPTEEVIVAGLPAVARLRGVQLEEEQAAADVAQSA